MSLVYRAAALAAASCLMAAPSFAGQVKVDRSVTLAADAAKTWDTVKDFGELHTCHPAVEKTDIKKGGDNKPGTVRCCRSRAAARSPKR